MPTVTSAPRVTVIVPVFNGERFLRESLDSILAQEYPNIDVIVMDDASTDATPEIIASYGDRVRCIRQSATHGIYDNANVGIAAATGEYVAIYHADDIYHPDIVATEANYLTAHPEVGAAFASDLFVDENGHEYARLQLPPDVRADVPIGFAEVFNGLLSHKNSFLRCPGAMVRASVYATVGVYRQDRFRNTADLDMWIRIAERYPVTVLSAHLYSYRHFPGQSSSRYHLLRTAPENYFGIMDHHLEQGARTVATPRALSHYEAHRSRDRLMAALAHYVLGQVPESRAALAEFRPLVVAGSGNVQRWRLLAIAAALGVFVRLPRLRVVAEAFRRRWFPHGQPVAA